MDLMSRIMEDEGWVSPHFRQNELACHCCGLYLENKTLLSALEKLREALGDRAIHVLSGTRCPQRNEEVGGASRSKHLYGQAADIVVRGKVPDEVAEVARTIEPFSHGGIGVYAIKGFTHLDVRTDGPARWRG